MRYLNAGHFFLHVEQLFSNSGTPGSRTWHHCTACAAGTSCTHQACPFLRRTCKAMFMVTPTAFRAGLRWRGLHRLWQRPGASPWICARPLRQSMSASSLRAPQVCASLPSCVYVQLHKQQTAWAHAVSKTTAGPRVSRLLSQVQAGAAAALGFCLQSWTAVMLRCLQCMLATSRAAESRQRCTAAVLPEQCCVLLHLFQAFPWLHL